MKCSFVQSVMLSVLTILGRVVLGMTKKNPRKCHAGYVGHPRKGVGHAWIDLSC